jgi:hypothetical protein
MMHPPYVLGNIGTTEILKDALRQLALDEDRMLKIICSVMKTTEADWAKLGYNEAWFSADLAVSAKIATEKGEFRPPKGTRLFSFSL